MSGNAPSGAIYSSVPTNELVTMSGLLTSCGVLPLPPETTMFFTMPGCTVEAADLDRSKSVNMMWPVSCSRMFSGFRSATVGERRCTRKREAMRTAIDEALRVEVLERE